MGIPANELRVGNWLIHQRNEITTELKQVKGIDYGGDSLFYEYYSQDGSQYPRGIEYFKPIPLTEEWLLKFGFKKLNNAFYIGDFKVMINQLQKGETGYDKYLFIKGIPIKPINEVHKIQNAFFEFKGEELTIK
jgi:hypothetical protein